MIEFFSYLAMANQENPVPMKSTPVGPVAGGIMGCFLVLALGVYCYRHHIHRSSHQYINNLPENQNRMSHFYEEEPPEPADDIAAGLWCYSIIFCHLNTWYVRNATNKKNSRHLFLCIIFHCCCFPPIRFHLFVG